MVSLKRIAFGLATINIPLTALAEPSELDVIKVDGTRMERSLLDTPAAVSVVNADSAQQGQQNIQLDESLARVPGLYLQTAITSLKTNVFPSGALARAPPLGSAGYESG